mmetsp:Transcript_3341/g.11743  ORF Transcript_3341/g.11743 Transcript_3341/m.11743 type:complete len:374 (-) Transcript_3341:539-1660(-)
MGALAALDEGLHLGGHLLRAALDGGGVLLQLLPALLELPPLLLHCLLLAGVELVLERAEQLAEAGGDGEALRPALGLQCVPPEELLRRRRVQEAVTHLCVGQDAEEGLAVLLDRREHIAEDVCGLEAGLQVERCLVAVWAAVEGEVRVLRACHDVEEVGNAVVVAELRLARDGVEGKAFEEARCRRGRDGAAQEVQDQRVAHVEEAAVLHARPDLRRILVRQQVDVVQRLHANVAGAGDKVEALVEEGEVADDVAGLVVGQAGRAVVPREDGLDDEQLEAGVPVEFAELGHPGGGGLFAEFVQHHAADEAVADEGGNLLVLAAGGAGVEHGEAPVEPRVLPEAVHVVREEGVLQLRQHLRHHRRRRAVPAQQL